MLPTSVNLKNADFASSDSSDEDSKESLELKPSSDSSQDHRSPNIVKKLSILPTEITNNIWNRIKYLKIHK